MCKTLLNSLAGDFLRSPWECFDAEKMVLKNVGAYQKALGDTAFNKFQVFLNLCLLKSCAFSLSYLRLIFMSLYVCHKGLDNMCVGLQTNQFLTSKISDSSKSISLRLLIVSEAYIDMNGLMYSKDIHNPLKVFLSFKENAVYVAVQSCLF